MSRSTPGRLPALNPRAMRITPLGGLGEIGRNMTVVEHAGRLVILDCGVLFPEEEHPGVDVILPDFSSLAGRWKDIDAIVLTHGHEDHIGGVPYLLRERPDIPVVGSRLTLAFITSKLTEHKIVPKTVEVAAGDRRKVGSFDLEFVAVNHSIPDGLAVAVRTPAGMIVDTGDFKMDQFPLDGRLTDVRHLSRLADEGIDLFLVDSTNAEVPGFTISERDLSPAIGEVFASTRRRVIVSSFASHVHRIQQVVDAAAAHGRKVGFVGRSMVKNMRIAQELGYLTVPEGVVVEPDKLDKLPDDQVTFVCTGSQGEPLAALSRMARGEHQIDVGEGDTVLLASSLIPGNETAIYRVINRLTDRGARVVHRGNARVHVSGHASAGELVYLYNTLRPRNVMPIHGEAKHLRANGDLALSTGMAPENVVVVRDGAVVDLMNGKVKVVGQVSAEEVYVEDGVVGRTDERLLAQRRALRDGGVVTVVAVIDSNAGTLAEPVELLSTGVVHAADAQGAVDRSVRTALSKATPATLTDTDALDQLVRRAAERVLRRRGGPQPVVVAVTVEA